MNRKRRLIIKSKEKGTIYHVVSRTVNKEFLWEEKAKGIFLRQLTKVASFCGVEVLSYCIMSNHFHLLVRVYSERSRVLSNEAIWERCLRLYTNPKDMPTLAAIQAALLRGNEQQVQGMRQKLLARMDDLSQFVKILKQRFSIWYNRSHGRWGTHWGERFQSVVVESTRSAQQAVAAYIALNPLRAGLCRDPKDYVYSSYAAAVAGDQSARKAMQAIIGAPEAGEALEEFRKLLYVVGALPKKRGGGVVIDPVSAKHVQKRGGRLSILEISKTKFLFFSRGLVIGSKYYLEELVRDGLVQLTKRTRYLPVNMESAGELATFRSV